MSSLKLYSKFNHGRSTSPQKRQQRRPYALFGSDHPVKPLPHKTYPVSRSTGYQYVSSGKGVLNGKSTAKG